MTPTLARSLALCHFPLFLFHCLLPTPITLPYPLFFFLRFVYLFFPFRKQYPVPLFLSLVRSCHAYSHTPFFLFMRCAYIGCPFRHPYPDPLFLFLVRYSHLARSYIPFVLFMRCAYILFFSRPIPCPSLPLLSLLPTPWHVPMPLFLFKHCAYLLSLGISLSYKFHSRFLSTL
ncbi:MAG: hypothetical protein J3R72DRAFT_46177 [Linnemannia gamsii]|nr:MAG: hypothetical protein J3R72DRAFT_46177 [Linnemannia gamsii]